MVERLKKDNFFTNYQFVSGCMFTSKEDRHYIPPNHIEISLYVFDAADWFDVQGDYSMIMVLHSTAIRITISINMKLIL